VVSELSAEAEAVSAGAKLEAVLPALLGPAEAAPASLLVAATR
jgi:hypothetical protein